MCEISLKFLTRKSIGATADIPRDVTVQIVCDSRLQPQDFSFLNEEGQAYAPTSKLVSKELIIEPRTRQAVEGVCGGQQPTWRRSDGAPRPASSDVATLQPGGACACCRQPHGEGLVTVRCTYCVRLPLFCAAPPLLFSSFLSNSNRILIIF